MENSIKKFFACSQVPRRDRLESSLIQFFPLQSLFSSSFEGFFNFFFSPSPLSQNQGMRRHTEAWRDSLRYGQPDLDKMQGIRRININNNPLVGNQGAQILAEALKDDLWIKGLYM